jgi:hypothetical protein
VEARSVNDPIVYELNQIENRREVEAIRHQLAGGQKFRRSSFINNVCVVTATESSSMQLLGVGLLVCNSRHGNIVVAVVSSSLSKKGIGARLAEKLVTHGRGQGLSHFGLTYDTRGPWLGFFMGA